LTVHITEFTTPEDPAQKRKDKWLFAMKDRRWFCIAGIWRAHEQVDKAFTMLTMDAGEDVAHYHHRQIIPLAPEQWADWLNPNIPAKDVLHHLPAGSLSVTRVFPPPPSAPEQTTLSL
jgi:putative SOS response-associated peptidase YedK